jgi:hypothetical protein
MTNVIDWILDLFRDPVAAQAFVNDPDKAMTNAGVQGVTAAQVNAVAATVAPAAVIHGGGNPVHGLQQAVAETHGFAYEPTFAPQTLSNNDTLSHNDTRLLSPETNVVNHAGEDQQQGVGNVDLDFGDITFGDKTTNTADHGSVINTGNAGDIDNTNVEGDGNVVGDGNVGANTGDILAGEGSTVQAGGVGNTSDSSGSIHNSGGGDVISGNEGPVVKTGDIDTSGGGASGGAGGHGGGILTGGGGDGGAATGGAGGGVVIAPTQTTTMDTHGGDVTTVDTHGGDISGSVDASHDDNSTGHNTDNSTHDSHNDNSTHDSHDATVDTHVDVSNDVGLF